MDDPKIELKTNALAVEPLGESLRRREELEFVREVRIATYNVFKLFGERPDVYSPQPHDPTSEKQLAALGEMILALDADAIAFQEVQNRRILKDLFQQHVNRALKKKGEEPFSSFVCHPAYDIHGINVALATRLAVRTTLSFTEYEFGPLDDHAFRFSRDLLGVELFATPEYRFGFFVAHLKSKLGGERSEDKRVLEAREIRKQLVEPSFGGAAYISQDMVLAGDMNDDPQAEAIAILQGGEPASALTDLLATVQPNYTWPTHHKRPKTRLDFILASPSLTAHVDRSSCKIYQQEPAAADASDHYPASVTIEVPAS